MKKINNKCVELEAQVESLKSVSACEKKPRLPVALITETASSSSLFDDGDENGIVTSKCSTTDRSINRATDRDSDVPPAEENGAVSMGSAKPSHGESDSEVPSGTKTKGGDIDGDA